MKEMDQRVDNLYSATAAMGCSSLQPMADDSGKEVMGMERVNREVMENRRKESRYPVKEGTKALFGKHMGTIVDVSKGGIGIRFAGEDVFPGYAGTVDIESHLQDFFLGHVPVQTISHCELEEEMVKESQGAKRCGLKFGDLKSHQRFQLDYLIWLSTHAMA